MEKAGCSICCRVGVCGAWHMCVINWGPVSTYACVCPSGQPGFMYLVHVCVWVAVSGLCTGLQASVCLYSPVFVMLLKAVLPLMINRVFQGPRLREDWSKSSSDTALPYNIVHQGPASGACQLASLTPGIPSSPIVLCKTLQGSRQEQAPNLSSSRFLSSGLLPHRPRPGQPSFWSLFHHAHSRRSLWIPSLPHFRVRPPRSESLHPSLPTAVWP